MAMSENEVFALLRGWDNILILTHHRPDGDTCGSAAGLCAGLRKAGKTAYVLKNPEVTSRYLGYIEFYYAKDGFVPDFVISVDTATAALLQINAKEFAKNVDLAIDHHITYSGYAKNACVDHGCAACGELIYRILMQLLSEITQEIALPLYLAVAADTGCFRYGNTTAASHRIAADLMDTGINAMAVNKKEFRTKTFERLKLENMIIDGLEIFDDGTIVVATLTLEMMARTGATEDDAEDVAGLAGQLAGTLASVTIRELSNGRCKISMRSSPQINSAAACALLGGGGHAAAGGCTVDANVGEAKRLILDAIRKTRGR